MPDAIPETIAALTPMEWRIILLVVLIFIGFWMVLAISSWARRLALSDRFAGSRPKSRPTTGPDAWSESGRRFRFDSPNGEDEFEDDDDEDEDEDEDDENGDDYRASG